MLNKTHIYTAVFWASLIAILAWLILKAIGIISTPAFIELFPYFSAVFGAGAFFQLVLNTFHRLNRVEARVNRIAEGLIKIETEFYSHAKM
ncbi:hypothetical protein HZB88_00050 [archaeon]|nr:hypothetical protein [archaeon]